jgi:iron complex outermembrane receptor protein
LFQVALAVITLVLTASSALAQAGGTAAINGTVKDAESGQPIEGASVQVRGTLLNTVTNAQGQFSLAGVPLAPHAIRVIAIGFAADTIPGVALKPGEVRNVAISLTRTTLDLQEIVVTASRLSERRTETPASVAVLPFSEILARNVSTINHALEFVPGVTFNGPDQMDIRGSTGFARGVGSRVLMLLDGHPALSADGGEINFRALPVIDLARTEVVKGAYSALYGSNALGGVVNLITTPVDDRPSTAARAHFDAYDVPSDYRWSDGLLNSQGLELQHSRRVGPMGARAFVGYQGTDGYTQNGQNHIWMARVKFQALPTATHQWDAFALYTNEKSQEFLTWRADSLPFEVSPQFLGDYARDQVFLSGATVAAIATARTLLKISPFLNWNSSQNEFTANQDHHAAIKPGINAALTRSLSPKNSFTVGGDAAYTWVSSNFIGSPEIVDAAVFVQDEARLGTNLKGEAGFRADYHDATTAQSEFVISPKIGASLRLSNAVTMRSSIGAGYRAPSAIEQFVNTFQFGFQVIPNPALQGERSWSAEIGTSTVLWNRLQVDAAVFGSRYSNLIGPAAIPGSSPLTFQFQNIANARVVGLDLGANATVSARWLNLAATFLFLDSKDLDTGQPLPYRSKVNVTGTVTTLQGHAGVDVHYRTASEEVLAYPLDPRQNILVFDLRLDYRLVGVLWQLKVSNLFNTFYTNVLERNPGAPRMIGLTAVYGL